MNSGVLYYNGQQKHSKDISLFTCLEKHIICLITTHIFASALYIQSCYPAGLFLKI